MRGPVDAQTLLDSLHSEGLLAAPTDLSVLERSEEATSATLDNWFGSSDWRDQGHSFVQLGQDGAGSLFAQWSHPGLDGEPPVVCFGASGSAKVVAGSTAEFVQLIGSGHSWHTSTDSWRPVEGDTAALKARTEAELGALPAPAAELLAKAGEGRPDFGAWATEYLDDMKATVPIPGRRA